MKGVFMKAKLQRLAGLSAVGGGLLAAASPSWALDSSDVTGIVNSISSTESAVIAIGGAVLVVIAAAAAFGWVRRALK
jgi:hypothetical protein